MKVSSSLWLSALINKMYVSVIRAAMIEGRGHPLDQFSLQGSIGFMMKAAADTAHDRSLSLESEMANSSRIGWGNKDVAGESDFYDYR